MKPTQNYPWNIALKNIASRYLKDLFVPKRVFVWVERSAIFFGKRLPCRVLEDISGKAIGGVKIMERSFLHLAPKIKIQPSTEISDSNEIYSNTRLDFYFQASLERSAGVKGDLLGSNVPLFFKPFLLSGSLLTAG